MTPEALLALAERCEQETPGRILDRDIADAIDYPDRFYTSALDAAVTLVPDGMAWSVSMDSSARALVNKWGEISEDGRAKTAASALCSAALQARAAIDANPALRRGETDGA